MLIDFTVIIAEIYLKVKDHNLILSVLKKKKKKKHTHTDKQTKLELRPMHIHG